MRLEGLNKEEKIDELLEKINDVEKTTTQITRLNLVFWGISIIMWVIVLCYLF